MFNVNADGKEVDCDLIAGLLGQLIEASNELSVLSETIELDEAAKRTFQQTANLVIDNLANVEGNLNG